MNPKEIIKDIEDVAMLQRAVIFCDIDGPLLDITHRLHYAKDKDYDKFYGCSMAYDDQNFLASPATVAFIYGIVEAYGGNNTVLVFNTGRPNRTRQITYLTLKEEYPNLIKLWKRLYTGENSPFIGVVQNRKMLMRGDEDYRPAGEVKVDNVVDFLDKYKQHLDPDLADVFVIDDDPEVLKAFETEFKKRMEQYNPICIQIGSKANYSELSKSSEE